MIQLFRRSTCSIQHSSLVHSAGIWALSFLAVTAAVPVHAEKGVSNKMLLNAQNNEDAWLHYGRNYQGWRHFPGDKINRTTVKRLVPVWTHQTGVTGGAFEVSATVYDNKLYITTPNSHLICVDPRDGTPIWRYDHPVPEDVNLCCGPVNRGVAILGNRVYYTTLDAHLICFDAETGLQLWDRMVGDYRDSLSLTLTPLVIGEKVIVGVAGGEYGIRGYIDAYHNETGERLWRLYTIPGPDEPGNDTWSGDSWQRGGAPAWLTGTYDPELNLLYWGTGNPGPDFNGDVRLGDNLHSDSLLAINPDTGELVWHFQFVPHDIFDWDAVAEGIVMDEVIDGREAKVIVQANRNGYLYVLDRATGKFLRATPYSKVDWANIDAEGKPVIRPELLKLSMKHVCPGIFGGKNWPPAAYSPKTHMVYIPDQVRCATFFSQEVTFRRGLPYYGGALIFDSNDSVTGYIRAVDIRTGEMKWEYETAGQPNWAGLLTTGGGLVFGGAADGYLRAFNDETGEVLWEYQTGSGIFAPPTSFEIDGRQYIGIASGWGQPSEGLGLRLTSGGSAYFLFGLLEE